jgi:hypothetical protein
MKKNLKLVALLLCSTAIISACSNSTTEETTTISSTAETTEEVTIEETTIEETSAKEAETANSNLPTELSDDIYSFQISIDEVVYQFPMKFSDFESTGWTYSGDETKLIPSNTLTFVNIFNNNVNMSDSVSSDVINFDINELPINQCYITGITIDSYSLKSGNVKVLMAKGIEFGISTTDDVKAAYGEPSDIYESASTLSYTYKISRQSSVQFKFNLEDNTIYTIDIANPIEPSDLVIGEVDTSVPAIVNAYKAPTAISDNIFSYTAEYANDLYTLPAPISVFLENGWTILENDSEMIIPGNSRGWVTIVKENQSYKSMVTNYSPNSNSAENSFITEIKSNSYATTVSMTIFNNISMGMTKADLETALEGVVFELSESSLSTNYNIKDPANGTNGYYITVTKETGLVSSISMKYVPRARDFYSLLGVPN